MDDIMWDMFYPNGVVGSDSRAEMIKEMQKNTDELLDNLASEFELKVGTKHYRQSVKINFEKEIYAVVKEKKMKDTVTNFNSYELMTEMNQVKLGDYISFRLNYNDIEEEHYLVRSRVRSKRNSRSDVTYITRCQYVTYLLDDDGNICRYPLAFFDNKTRMRLGSNENMDYANGDYECYIRNDLVTSNIMDRIKRILIYDTDSQKYRALDITDIDPYTLDGLITLKMRRGTIDTDDDNLELCVANYKSQMEKLNPTITPGEITGEDFIYLGESEIYTTDKPCTFTLSGSATLNILSDTSCEIEVDADSSFVGNILTLYAKIGYITYQKQIYIRRW